MGFLDIFKWWEAPPPSPPLSFGVSEGAFFYTIDPVVPDPYKEICFYENSERVAQEFVPMVLEMINQILPPYYVVTWVRKGAYTVTFEGKPIPPSPETFMSDYKRFLSAFGVPNVISEQKNEIVIQTGCGNAPITKLLLDEDPIGFDFSMCAYHEPIELLTIDQAKAQIRNYNYVIHFDYDPCPQHLSIIFDTRIISIDDLKRIIAGVCVRYGKELDSDL